MASWEQAVHTQYERAISGLPDHFEVEASLFAVSLRNLLRAARMGLELERDAIQAALDHFDEAIPKAVRIRNVLEHFDDYLDLAGEYLVAGDESSITLIGRDGATLELNLDQASQAARRLATSVCRALGYDQ